MKKIVFLHIQKTAGNTLQQVLFNNRKGYVAFDYTNGERLTPTLLQTLQKRYPFKISGIGGHQLDCTQKNSFFGDDQFTFTVLRDPLDRYISFYNHLITKQGYDFTFDFYLTGEPQRNFQTKAIAKEENAEKAIAILQENFDFVGLFESMQETTERLGSMLNLDTNQKSLNHSKVKAITKADLTDEQMKLALANNQEDYKVYAFAKQRFESLPDYTPSHIQVSSFRKVIGWVLKKLSLAYVNRLVLK